MSVLLGFVNVVDNPGPPDLRARDGRARGSPKRGQPQQRRDEQLADRRTGDVRRVDRPCSASAPCFYINAASYVAVIVALMMMDASLLHRLPTVERAKGQLREGLRYAWSEPMVRVPLLMMAVIGTLAFNFQVVIPLIATKTFDRRGRSRRCCSRPWARARCSAACRSRSRRGVSLQAAHHARRWRWA